MKNILKSRVLNDNDSDFAERNISKADVVWLDSITKRQKLIIGDLIEFSNSYPECIDRETVGSFICLYELLADTNESLKLSEAMKVKTARFYR